MTTHNDRSFDVIVDAPLTDEQLSELLRTVYVSEGYTPNSEAEKLFAPSSVRARGTILVAQEPSTRAPLGMVILVPPGSPVRRTGRDDDAEIHLLAVRPEARRRGIARALMEDALRLARGHGWPRIWLSTQTQMTAAQALYTAAGFTRRAERDWRRGEREFLAYFIELGGGRDGAGEMG
jgi:ribosomal protein S18 acetylase RimI-like enzyme